MTISAAQQKIIDDFDAQRTNASDGVISRGQSSMIEDLEIREDFDPDMAEQSSQLGRFGLQGLTFGFADEIEAMGKVALARIQGGELDYVTARNEIRQKLAEYAEENGGKALMAEMAGAVVPTVASVFGGPGGWSAALSNITRMSKGIFQAGKSGQSILQTATRSGGATSVYALGSSEKEAFGEDADKLGLGTDMGTGFGFGFTIGGTIAGLGKLASPFVTRQLEKLRSKKNDKLSLAIRRELDRMVKKTGFSEEEIIQKVADGEIIVENESLRYWIKQIVAQAETGKPALVLKDTLQGKPPVYNEAGELIEDRIVSRPKQTRDELQTTMQESIKRGTSKKDLLKAYQQTDDEFRAIETAAYNKILKKNNTELDNATLDVLLQSIRRFEGGAETINKMIAGDELVKKAFYKIDDETGEIILTRMPTLADAELIYRSIRNQATKLSRRGENDLAGVLYSNMHKLKTQINKFSPKLKQTRANAHTLRASREAFLQGRKLLNMGSEDVASILRNIEKHSSYSKAATKKAHAQILQSLREGVLVQLKSKDGLALMRNIHKDNKQLYNVISKIFPDDKVDDIITKARIASQADDAASKIPVTAGAQSTPLAEAGRDVATSAAGGDWVMAIVRPLMKGLKDRNVPDKEAMAIVKLVTEQNPELVKKALVDDNAMNMLQKIMDSLITKGSQVVGRTEAKVKGTELAQDYDPAAGLGQWGKGLLQNFGAK